MTFLYILCLTLPCCLVMCLAHDETGEAEDEDTAADDGETEIVEHHGPGLHQVPRQDGEDLVSERVADGRR